MSESQAIVFEGVRRHFGAHVALDGIDLTIVPSSFVSLVGRSGSGKSTLLKTINRLIRPESGTITIDGRDIAGEKPHLLRRRIGYVFQNIGLFPHLSVAENIAIGLKIAGAGESEGRVRELLAMVDLPADFAARRPAQLSGGQAQRVGIARALATGPKLLLMDEPFGALDPVTRDGLGRKVRALHDELDLTTVLVTHDMAEALLLSDRVLVMAEGRIAADGTPAELLAGKGGATADELLAVPRDQARALALLGA